MDYMVKYYQNLAEELLHKKLQLIEELKVLSEKRMSPKNFEDEYEGMIAREKMYGIPRWLDSEDRSWGDWQEGDEDSPNYNPYFTYNEKGEMYSALSDTGDPLAMYDREGRPLRFDPRSDRRPAELTSTQASAAATDSPAPPPMLAADGNNQPEVLPPNLPPQNEVPPLVAVGEPGSPGVAPLPATPTPSSFAPIVPGAPIPAPRTPQTSGGSIPPTASTPPAAPASNPAAPTAPATPTDVPSGYAPRSAYNFKQDPRYMAGAKDMFQDERNYKAMRRIGMSDYAISKRNEQRAAMDQLRDIESKKAAGLPVSQRDMQDDAFLRAKYGVGSRNLSAPVKQAYTGLSRPPEGSWKKFQQANQASNAPVPAPQSPAANTTAAAATAAAQGRASAKPGSKAESLAKAINPVQAALSRATQTGMAPNVGAQPPAPLVPGPKRPEANTAAAAASAAARGAASPLPGSRAESLARAINPVQAALNRATQTGMAPNRTAIGSGMSEPQETEALTPAQIAARNTLGMGTTPPPAKPRKTAAQRTMGL